MGLLKNYTFDEKLIFSSKSILIIGLILIFTFPILFTQCESGVDFTKTGEIGDTIGGITAPVVNLIGSLLVFIALLSQIEANRQLNKRLDVEQNERNINYLYTILSQQSSLYQNEKSKLSEIKITTQWKEGMDSIQSFIDDIKIINLNMGLIPAGPLYHFITKPRINKILDILKFNIYLIKKNIENLENQNETNFKLKKENISKIEDLMEFLTNNFDYSNWNVIFSQYNSLSKETTIYPHEQQELLTFKTKVQRIQEDYSFIRNYLIKNISK